MSKKTVLVTGANGFIGTQLATKLIASDVTVRCLVRAPEKGEPLVRLGCEIAIGDITNPASLPSAVEGVDEIYHLAGQTRKTKQNSMMTVNRDGTCALLDAASKMQPAPRFIFVSSLAAAGPGRGDQPIVESDKPQPVSKYGESKLAAEQAAFKYADQMPISIVRPPIVFGAGDRCGFQMFDLVSRFGLHLVSGPKNAKFSFIHVDDLVDAIILVATHGKTLDKSNPSQGIYFVAAEIHPTFAEMGQMIGQSVGRKRVRILKARKLGISLVAAANETISFFTGKVGYLNWDKSKEAVAGPWYCSSEKLEMETGFRVKRTLQQRIDQSTEWFIKNGWMKPLSRPQKTEQRDPYAPTSSG